MNVGTAKAEYSGEIISDSDPSHYFGVCPPCLCLEIQKYTNGVDADAAPGPEITVGDTVTWTYVVTNCSDVTLNNIEVTDDILGYIGTIDSLAPGDSDTLTHTGTATVGQYVNVGTAEAEYLSRTVTDSDSSHYFGVCPSCLCLEIQKYTNGDDADAAPGPEVTVGDTVTWTYVVTNCGNVTLNSIEVTDDILGYIGTINSLAPGESATLTETGTATVGQYVNVGTAEAEYLSRTVTDSDSSHYFGVESVNLALDIEKYTNDEDADTAPGPYILVDSTVTWTYIVTNNSNVALTNIEVTDDILGHIGAIDSLAPGESATLTETGTSTLGQYANIGTSEAEYLGEIVSDSDPSHYFGVDLCLDIEKHTNGQDADTPTGPKVLVGDSITWEFIVTNNSNVTLIDIEVTDDILGPIGTIDSLAPGESVTLIHTGTASTGQYENTGTATAEYLGQSVTDTDLSHYCGIECAELAIDIEKYTNDEDADTAPGPSVTVGDTITWTYVITNISIITLTNIEVTDDILGPIGTIDSLDPGESATLTHTGTASAGQYENTGTATAVFLGQTITDFDLSHHHGVYPTSDSTDDPTSGDGGQGGEQNGSDGQDGDTDSQGDSSSQDGDSNSQDDVDDQNGDTGSGEGSNEDDSNTVVPGESDDDSSSLTVWGLAGAILIGIIAFIFTVALGLFLRRRSAN